MMERIFAIQDNKLLFKTGKVLEFDLPIIKRSVLLIDFVIVVVLEVPKHIINNQNVFGISSSGNLLWQIGRTEFFHKKDDCPFVDAKINDSGQLVLFNWCDTGVIVEPITGKILDRYLTH